MAAGKSPIRPFRTRPAIIQRTALPPDRRILRFLSLRANGLPLSDLMALESQRCFEQRLA